MEKLKILLYALIIFDSPIKHIIMYLK